MAGRPKKPEGEVKNNVLRIRLTPAERAILNKTAQTCRQDTSTWARVALLRASRTTTEAETDLTYSHSAFWHGTIARTVDLPGVEPGSVGL